MQEKSAEKYSQANRLKRVRIVSQSNWDALAKEMKLSEAMIYAVLAGRKELGPKSLYRLEVLETAFGIEKPIEESALHEGGDLRSEVEIWKRRAKQAEGELEQLRKGLRALIEIRNEIAPGKRRASSKSASELAEHERLLSAAEDKGHDS